MTLNGVMAVILHYFAKFGSYGANYVKFVEAKPIYCGDKNYAKESSLWQYSTYGDMIRD